MGSRVNAEPGPQRVVVLLSGGARERLETFHDSVRAKGQKRLPTVLTKGEVLKFIGFLSGKHKVMARMLYGSGLCLMECVRPRVSYPVLAA